MLAKIYVLLWLSVALVAAVLLVTEKLTLTGVVVFGLIAFALTFVGAMRMLPRMASRPGTSIHQTENGV